MRKWMVSVGVVIFKIITFPFVVVLQMTKGMFGHDNPQPHYWRGDTKPITRPESYRTLKRRNRKMRKYSHKTD